MQRTTFQLAILLLILLFSLPISLPVNGKPKTTTLFAKTPEGYIKAKIKNETFEELACYIAIDGYKKKFRLSGNLESKWVAATDKRFAYTSFSTWCDYIEFYPQYKKYNLG